MLAKKSKTLRKATIRFAHRHPPLIRMLRGYQYLRASEVARLNQRDDERAITVMSALLRPDSICVDVGANVGKYLAHMCRIAPAARHIAFEPVPELAASLEVAFPNITVMTTAVGGKAGVRRFTVVVGRLTRSGFDAPGAAPHDERIVIEVPVVTLDEVLSEVAPVFIKLDVEGAELEAMRGASDVVRRARPVIMFEFRAMGGPAERMRADGMWDQVSGMSMRLFDLEGNGPFDRETFWAHYRDDTKVNYLAVPV